MITNIIETHAIGATNQHAGSANFLLNTFLQKWRAVIVQCQRRHDNRSRHTRRDCIVERGLQPVVAYSEHDHVGDFRQFAHTGITLTALQVPVPRVNRVDVAGVATFFEVLQRPFAQRIAACGCPDDRNRAGS